MSHQLRDCSPPLFARFRGVAASLLAAFALLLALLSGQATAATPQVSAGAYHSVAIRVDGTLCGEMVSDPKCCTASPHAVMLTAQAAKHLSRA